MQAMQARLGQSVHTAGPLGNTTPAPNISAFTMPTEIAGNLTSEALESIMERQLQINGIPMPAGGVFGRGMSLGVARLDNEGRIVGGSMISPDGTSRDLAS
jgi:hypothetical protein